MESLLSKRFFCKARLGRLFNELQEATFEDPDHISVESTNLFKVLHDRYKMKHINREFEIKPNILFLLVATFSSVKYFLLQKNFSEYFSTACFEENMKTKISNYVGTLC